MSDLTEWELDRLPAIKEELKQNGYVCYPERHVNVTAAVFSCWGQLLLIVGVALASAGLASNPLLGAGVGLITSAIYVGYSAKRSLKKLTS